MAAITSKHVKGANVLSFEEEIAKKKVSRRKQPYVKVSYDSGSDADAESGDDNDEITGKS